MELRTLHSAGCSTKVKCDTKKNDNDKDPRSNQGSSFGLGIEEFDGIPDRYICVANTRKPAFPNCGLVGESESTSIDTKIGKGFPLGNLGINGSSV